MSYLCKWFSVIKIWCLKIYLITFRMSWEKRLRRSLSMKWTGQPPAIKFGTSWTGPATSSKTSNINAKFTQTPSVDCWSSYGRARRMDQIRKCVTLESIHEHRMRILMLLLCILLLWGMGQYRIRITSDGYFMWGNPQYNRWMLHNTDYCYIIQTNFL